MATLTITNARAEDLALLVCVLEALRGTTGAGPDRDQETYELFARVDTTNWSFQFGESASRFNAPEEGAP